MDELRHEAMTKTAIVGSSLVKIIPFSPLHHPNSLFNHTTHLFTVHTFPPNSHFIRRGMENRIDSLFGKKKAVPNTAKTSSRVDAGIVEMSFFTLSVMSRPNGKTAIPAKDEATKWGFVEEECN